MDAFLSFSHCWLFINKIMSTRSGMLNKVCDSLIISMLWIVVLFSRINYYDWNSSLWFGAPRHHPTMNLSLHCCQKCWIWKNWDYLCLPIEQFQRSSMKIIVSIGFSFIFVTYEHCISMCAILSLPLICLQISWQKMLIGNGLFSRRRATRSTLISRSIGEVLFVDITSIHFHFHSSRWWDWATHSQQLHCSSMCSC